jgi:hypothetical protein
MSGYTGYIASSGYDLSLIFQGGTTNIITGFKLANGDDISTIFSAYSTAYAPSTGLISVGGVDISTYFNRIIFSPLTIAGCCLWMDANDSSKISPAPTNNSTINTWTDKSPNAYVFSSPTTAKPKFILNSQNSKSTILFASASLQYFFGNTNTNSFALNTSSYALFAVFKKTGTNTNASMYSKSAFNASTNRILLVIANNKLNCGFTHDASTGKIPLTNNTSTEYQIISVIINRAQGIDTSYVNGTSAGTYTYTSDSTTDFTASAYDTLIGAYNSSTGTGTPQSAYYLNGNICEIISYKNTYDMTVQTREKIEGYLAYRWNLQSVLPSLHTYKNSYP